MSAYIGRSGPLAIAFGDLPSAQKGWLQVMKNMELTVLEAAVKGDYGLALEAFTVNPQIVSGGDAKHILDELFIAHKKYLPQFKDTIKRLEEEGITIKDDKARSLTEAGV